MTDLCDRASVLEQALHETALAAHRAARCAEPAAPDGRCIGCGDPIPPERLAARPGAARCVECQEREERR